MIRKSNTRVSSLVLATLAASQLTYAELEEVIVTAQKREQNLQDVPMAITALSSELLKNNEVNNIQDLTKLVPSLRMTTKDTPSNSSIRIRGVGTDVGSAAVEPNVSIVIDEVPLARNELASFEFSDLERIEVLRGPQGTLFGKNSTAGLVHVISRDPAEEVEAGLRLSYEQPDSFPGSLAKVQFSGSGPISDTMGLRVSGFYRDDQGIYEDIEQNNTGPNLTMFGARTKFVWDVSDILMAKFSVDYQQQRGPSTPIAFRDANPTKAENNPDIEYNEHNRKIKTYGNNRADITNMGTSLLLAWELDEITVNSITGYRKFQLDTLTAFPDLNGEDEINVIGTGGYRNLETITQEFRISSNGMQSLEYTAGILLFNNKVDENDKGLITDIPASIVVGGAVPGLPFELPAVTGVATFGQSGNTFSEVETSNIGLYAQSTWHISDEWHLTTGARYIHEKMSASTSVDDKTFNDDTGQEISSNKVSIPTTSFSDDAIIGTASLAYDWSENSIIYGTVSTGYRGGAFDLNATEIEDAFENPVDPETAFNTELGIKSRLFDNSVELNIAIFRTIFDDFQAQLLKLGSGNELVVLKSTQLANAGQLEIKGVEIDVQAQPIDSLFIFGSLLYSENKFNDFNGPCFVGQEAGEKGGVDEDGDGSCDTQDLAGAVLPHSPKASVSIGGRYEVNFADDMAYIGVLGRWQDDVQFNTEQHPGTIQEAYSVWNMRLGWINAEHHLEVAAYVNNLFAQSYAVHMVPISVKNDRRDVTHFLTRDADRVFGLSMSYDF